MDDATPQETQNTEKCSSCQTVLDLTGCSTFSDVTCPVCEHVFKACAVFNQYQITSLLGEGGMGSAYRAIDLSLEREVALKVLKFQIGERPKDVENLAREARTTAQVNHPNIVRIFDFGQAHGKFYIAMELIGGGSLDDLIQQRGMIPEILALEVGIQVAQGLKAAMEFDLIHRDIKPANILFSNRGTVKLVDFGLAVVASGEATSPTEIWGTPYYVAPEKLDELPEDFRSDIYSLGGTLFHAMAGRPPYEAENGSLVALKQLKSRSVSLQAFAPDISNETAYVINRMMSKKPEDRYQSYDDLIDHLSFALGKAKETQLVPAKKASSELRNLDVESKAMRWVALLFPIAVGLGLLVFALLYFFTSIFKAPEY